jgi:hypothetical protein
MHAEAPPFAGRPVDVGDCIVVTTLRSGAAGEDKLQRWKRGVSASVKEGVIGRCRGVQDDAAPEALRGRVGLVRASTSARPRYGGQVFVELGRAPQKEAGICLSVRSHIRNDVSSYGGMSGPSILVELVADGTKEAVAISDRMTPGESLGAQLSCKVFARRGCGAGRRGIRPRCNNGGSGGCCLGELRRRRRRRAPGGGCRRGAGRAVTGLLAESDASGCRAVRRGPAALRCRRVHVRIPRRNLMCGAAGGWVA